MASIRYPGNDASIATRVDRLCKEHLEEHVFKELNLIEDDMNVRIRTKIFAAVLKKHYEALHTVFIAYAAADKTSSVEARRTLNTMNVRECHEMCEDSQHDERAR